MNRLHFLAITLACLIITACTNQGVKSPPPAQSWEQHRATLSALGNWRLKGKIALRTATQAESANMVWTQQGPITQLQLSGPLGAAATQIWADGETLKIRRNGQTDSYDMSSPQAIVANTGWDLPLRQLPHWLLGIPFDETLPADTQFENSRLQRLSEQGWTIHYEQYRTVADLELPQRITIEREDSRARIIIQDWQINQVEP